MKREFQNYVFIFMGFLVLFLLYLFHFLENINSLIYSYNDLVKYINDIHGETLDYIYVNFFGGDYATLNLLVDFCIIGIICIIFLMIFLKIYWSVK